MYFNRSIITLPKQKRNNAVNYKYSYFMTEAGHFIYIFFTLTFYLKKF